MSGSSSAAVESTMRSEASSRPGRRDGSEPVATIACLKRTFWGSSPSTRSSRELSNTARPPITSTPLPLATDASPRASRPTTRSAFHLRSGSSETRGSPNSTPISRARPASSISAATCSSALEGMQPSQRQAPPRRLPATTATSTSITRSPITTAGSPRRSPVEEQLLWTLEAAYDGRGEARTVGAVGDAVVERERDRQERPRHDLALEHHGLLAGARHAENGHLGVVDDRDRAGAAQRADVGDRERPTSQVVERGLALADTLGERR